jgi:capsular exopolysaccharide synthesis family protein
MVGEERKDATLGDYTRLILRRKWVVLGVTVLLVAAAGVYSLLKTPVYRASAQLLYETGINVADPLSTGGYVDPSVMQRELNNVDASIHSPDLVASAQEILGPDVPLAAFTVTAAPDVQSGASDSSTVSISAVSADPRIAAEAANAFAQAFTEARRKREQERVQKAEAVIKKELASFQTEASRASADYLTLRQRLQDLQILEETVTGNFILLVPATVPEAPFSPRLLLNVLVSLLAGLFLGVVAAILLEQFDTRVRTADEAVAILDMPLLCHIGKMTPTQIERQPLYVLNNAQSQAAEAVRKLRSNLEFADVDNDLKSLLITSCLQHEGKSLTVCNLALSLAATGRHVALVDGDLRNPQIHRYLRLENAIGLSTVLTGKTGLHRTLRSVSARSGPTMQTRESASYDEFEPSVHVLPSGPIPPNAGEMIASRGFADLMHELRQDFDLVIVDTPALLAVGDTAAVAACVDGLIFLADLTRAKRPLLHEASRQIAQMPCRRLGLVALSERPRLASYDHYTHYSHGEPTHEVTATRVARAEGLALTAGRTSAKDDGRSSTRRGST